jgi:EAL domain-containing protein (putative c-di-GMP-specific phosphodiesterase class I)
LIPRSAGFGPPFFRQAKSWAQREEGRFIRRNLEGAESRKLPVASNLIGFRCGEFFKECKTTRILTTALHYRISQQEKEMNSTLIKTLNEKMQDALLHDFQEHLIPGKACQYFGRYRGFHLESVFQPLVANEGAILGYEALLRPSLGRTLQVETQFVFQYIEKTGGLVVFDRICRTLHLLNFLPFSSGRDLLFIHVHPALLSRVDSHGKVFESILQSLSVPPDRVVIELEESAPEEPFLLDKALRNFRRSGFKIAISDFGKERSDFKRLWRISPDFVKLHNSILHTAVNDEKARRSLPKLVELIHQSESVAVIQGVDTPEQLAVAEQSGARFRQGFCLSRPNSAVYWLKQKNAWHPAQQAEG